MIVLLKPFQNFSNRTLRVSHIFEHSLKIAKSFNAQIRCHPTQRLAKHTFILNLASDICTLSNEDLCTFLAQVVMHTLDVEFFYIKHSASELKNLCSHSCWQLRIPQGRGQRETAKSVVGLDNAEDFSVP